MDKVLKFIILGLYYIWKMDIIIFLVLIIIGLLLFLLAYIIGIHNRKRSKNDTDKNP